MPLTDPALWAWIESYPLPTDSAGTSFEAQLMSARRLSADAARAAIREYRRFVYLCAIRDSRSVPSRMADGAWHLHLSHTRDYWDRFVPDILDGRELHHAPGTPDGHEVDFEATRERYEAEFDSPPPRALARNWYLGSVPMIVTIMLAFIAITIGGAAGYGSAAAIAASTVVLSRCSPWLERHGIHIEFSVKTESDDGGGGCGD